MHYGLPLWLSGKESACNAGDLGLIPGLGRSPGEGKGYPLQYSGLENSMDCIVQGVPKSQTRLSDFHLCQSIKPAPVGSHYLRFLTCPFLSTASPESRAILDLCILEAAMEILGKPLVWCPLLCSWTILNFPSSPAGLLHAYQAVG